MGSTSFQGTSNLTGGNQVTCFHSSCKGGRGRWYLVVKSGTYSRGVPQTQEGVGQSEGGRGVL